MLAKLISRENVSPSFQGGNLVIYQFFLWAFTHWQPDWMESPGAPHSQVDSRLIVRARNYGRGPRGSGPLLLFWGESGRLLEQWWEESSILLPLCPNSEMNKTDFGRKGCFGYRFSCTITWQWSNQGRKNSLCFYVLYQPKVKFVPHPPPGDIGLPEIQC